MFQYKISKYNLIYQVNQSQLFFVNSLYNKSGNIITNDANKIIQGKFDYKLLDEDIINQLLKLKFLVKKELNENNINNYLSTRKLFLNKLNIQIILGQRCNMNCTYCGQEHTNVYDLELKECENLYKYINIELPKKKSLSINWIGGEPLLYFDKINKISKELINISEKRRCNYSSSIVTNGLQLNRDNFEELVSSNKISKFMITIDGTKDIHNSLRINNQKNSHEIIWRNIKEIMKVKPSYVTVLIRINVSEKMLGNEKQIADEFKVFNEFKTINILVIPTVDQKKEVKEVSIDKYLDFCLKLKYNGLKFSPVFSLNFMSAVCTNAYDGNFVFDFTGNLKKCSMEKKEISIDELYKDKDMFDYLEEWSRKMSLTKCRDCKALPMCQGLVCPHKKNECMLEMIFSPKYAELLADESTECVILS